MQPSRKRESSVSFAPLTPYPSPAIDRGIADGDNPAEFNPSDPIRLWIIQVSKYRALVSYPGSIGADCADTHREQASS